MFHHSPDYEIFSTLKCVYTKQIAGIISWVIAVEISIRSLVADLAPLRTRFSSVIIHVVFILENVQWDRLFLGYLGFTLAVSSHLCSIYTYIRSSNTDVK
jgi:hypothetical protein